MKATPERRWATALRRRLPDLDPAAITALVADRVAIALGAQPLTSGVETAVPAVPAGWDALEPPCGWADPWLVGVVHEQAAAPADRKARGAWYTPRSVVEGLTAAAFAALDELDELDERDECGQLEEPSNPVGGDVAADGEGVVPGLVVDPTCGGGAFLLAALDRMVDRGLDPAEALTRVRGVDLDAGAVLAARLTVALWAVQRDLDPALALGTQREGVVRHGDVLAAPEALRADEGGPVVVLGNPPFASPLRAGAVPGPAQQIRRARSDLLGPYADLGAVHLVHALRAVEVDRSAVVALIEPQSVLAGRDTEGLRALADDPDSPVRLAGVWATREAVFEAGVRACAPILTVGGSRSAPDRSAAPLSPDTVGATSVALYRGPLVTPAGRAPHGPWGALAADALGAPALPPFGPDTLGALVQATAGFRDEHYALVAACREWTGPVVEGAPSVAPGGPGSPLARVVTVGAVDPLWHGWGTAPIRFGGSTWERPVVDDADLPPGVARWLDRLRRPKVLVATQARLLEPVVDRDGSVAPATPLVAVLADPADLDRVVAVLLAPPVVLWAWRRWFGTAMSVDAVKLAARQVGELPLPVDPEAWAEAAALVATADAVGDGGEARALAASVAAIMNEAYGAGPEVLAWWEERLGRRNR